MEAVALGPALPHGVEGVNHARAVVVDVDRHPHPETEVVDEGLGAIVDGHGVRPLIDDSRAQVLEHRQRRRHRNRGAEPENSEAKLVGRRLHRAVEVGVEGGGATPARERLEPADVGRRRAHGVVAAVAGREGVGIALGASDPNLLPVLVDEVVTEIVGPVPHRSPQSAVRAPRRRPRRPPRHPNTT